jgi:hypothetical protein
MPWKTFLMAHSGAVATADFFSGEPVTRWGLVGYRVLFVIDLKTDAFTSRASPAGVTARMPRSLSTSPTQRPDSDGLQALARRPRTALHNPLREHPAGGRHIIPSATTIRPASCENSWSTNTPTQPPRPGSRPSPSPPASRPQTLDRIERRQSRGALLKYSANAA